MSRWSLSEYRTFLLIYVLIHDDDLIAAVAELLTSQQPEAKFYHVIVNVLY